VIGAPPSDAPGAQVTSTASSYGVNPVNVGASGTVITAEVSVGAPDTTVAGEVPAAFVAAIENA
jgi:hypothetical protein